MVMPFAGHSSGLKLKPVSCPVRYVLAHKALLPLDRLEPDLITLRCTPGLTVVACHARTCIVEGPRTLRQMRDLLLPLRGWTAHKEHVTTFPARILRRR